MQSVKVWRWLLQEGGPSRHYISNDYSVVAISNLDGFTVTNTSNIAADSFNMNIKNATRVVADALYSFMISHRQG